MESMRSSSPRLSSLRAQMSPAISQLFSASSSSPRSRHISETPTNSNTSQNPLPAGCWPSPFHMNSSTSSLPSADDLGPRGSPSAVSTPSTAASSFPPSDVLSSAYLASSAGAFAHSSSQPLAAAAACTLPGTTDPYQSAAAYSTAATSGLPAAAACYLPAGATSSTNPVGPNLPVPCTAAASHSPSAAGIPCFGVVPATAALSASDSSANGAAALPAAAAAATDSVSASPQPSFATTAAATPSPQVAAAGPAVLVVLSCEQQLTAASSADVFSPLPDIKASSLSFSSSSSPCASFTSSSCGRRCVQGGGGRAAESAEFLAEAGVSLTSLLTVHHVFENTGISYRIATPTGHPPAVSNVRAAPADAAAVAVGAGSTAAVAAALEKSVPPALYQQLLHPLPLRSVKLSDFQGLLLPHHLGAALDLLHSSALAQLVAAALPPPHKSSSNKKSSFRARECGGREEEKPLIVCAVGYGAFALCAKRLPSASATTHFTAADFPEREEAATAHQRWGWTADPTPSSKSPFDGYVLTSVSPFDECRYPFFGQLPYMLQELLEDNGATFVSFSRSLDSPACVVDRNIVTGPSEASTQVCLQVFALLLLNAAAAAADRSAVAGTRAVTAAGATATVHAAAAASAAASVETVAVAAVKTAAEERQNQLLLVLAQQRQQEQRQQTQQPTAQQQPSLHQHSGTYAQCLTQHQEKLVQHQQGHLQRGQPVQHQQLSQPQPLLQKSPTQHQHHRSLQPNERQTPGWNSGDEDFQKVGFCRGDKGAAETIGDSTSHFVKEATCSVVPSAATAAPSRAPAATAALPKLSQTGVPPGASLAAGEVIKLCSAGGDAASEVSARQASIAPTVVPEEIYQEQNDFLRSSTPLRIAVSSPAVAQTSWDGNEEERQLQNVRSDDAERQASGSSAADRHCAVGDVAGSSIPPSGPVAAAVRSSAPADVVSAVASEAVESNTAFACGASAAATPATRTIDAPAAAGCSSSRDHSVPRSGDISLVTSADLQRQHLDADTSSSCRSGKGGSALSVHCTAGASDSYHVAPRACVDRTNSERDTGREEARDRFTVGPRTSAYWNFFEEGGDAARERAFAPSFASGPPDTAAGTSGAAGWAGARDVAKAAADREKSSGMALPGGLQHTAATSHMWTSSRYNSSNRISSSGFATSSRTSNGGNSSGRSSDSGSTCNTGGKREDIIEADGKAFVERTRGAKAAGRGQQFVLEASCQKPEPTEKVKKHEGDLHAEEVRATVPVEGRMDNEVAFDKAAPFNSPDRVASRRNAQQRTALAKEDLDCTADPESPLKTCHAAHAPAASAGTDCAGPAASVAAASGEPAHTRTLDLGDNVAVPDGGGAVCCAHTEVDGGTEIDRAHAEGDFEIAPNSRRQSGDGRSPACATLHKLHINTGATMVLEGASSTSQSSKAFYSLTETGEPSPGKGEHFTDVEYSSVAGSTEPDLYWSRPKRQQQHSVRAGTAAGAPFRAATSCATSSAASVCGVAVGVASHIAGVSDGVKTVGSNATSFGERPKFQTSSSTERVTEKVDEQTPSADETRSGINELNIGVDTPRQPTGRADTALSDMLLHHEDKASVATVGPESPVTHGSALQQRERQMQQLLQEEYVQQEEQHLLQLDQLQQQPAGLADERRRESGRSTGSKADVNEWGHPLPTDHMTRVSDRQGTANLPQVPRLVPAAPPGATAQQDLCDSQEDDEFGNFIANPLVPVSTDLSSLAAVPAPGSSGFTSFVDMKDAKTADSAVGASSTQAPAGRDAVPVAHTHSRSAAGKTASTFEGFSSSNPYRSNTESCLLSTPTAYDEQRHTGVSPAEQEPLSRSDWFQWH